MKNHDGYCKYLMREGRLGMSNSYLSPRSKVSRSSSREIVDDCTHTNSQPQDLRIANSNYQNLHK